MSDRLPAPRESVPTGAIGPGRTGANTDPSDAARLAERLRDLHEQRVADEREAASLPSLLRAIAMTRRDRDGESSRTLRAHREQLERVMAETEGLLVTAAQTAVQFQRRDADDPIARRGWRAIDAAVQAVHQLARGMEDAA